MRVAFMFEESYPNYDLDLKLFTGITPENLRRMNTLVRSGGLFFGWPYDTPSDSALQLGELFDGGKGNIRQVYARLGQVSLNSIYVILVDSLERQLAWELDQRLLDQADYLGFTQVLPNELLHQRIFSYCEPRYHVAGGQISILHGESSSDEFADEIIKWWQDNAGALRMAYLTTLLSKRNIGNRFTVLDAEEHLKRSLALQKCIQQLTDEWEVRCEQTLYALQDRVPDALTEFLQAVETLSEPDLTAADCASIAVNLRRTLELLTEFVIPGDDTVPGWVQARWKQYRQENADTLGSYGELLLFEVSYFDETVDKQGRSKVKEKRAQQPESMLRTTHQGVHDAVNPAFYRGVVLHMLLLIDAIVSLKAGQRVVRPDPRFFDEVLTED